MTDKSRDSEGKFVEGENWREEKPFWSEDWLRKEYWDKGRTTQEIADDFGVTDSSILHWMRKHNIQRRNISEVRELKSWGVEGEDNPMYGRTGKDNPHWKGGVTAERQDFYSTKEWKKTCSNVWNRDDATCQRCGEKHTEDKEFHIHHIVSFQVEELRAEEENLVLLCEDCHWWVHSNENQNNEYIENKYEEL